MKQIHEMKAQRAELISKMEAITAVAELTPEMRTEWNSFDTQIKQIDEDIVLAERTEALNKSKVAAEAPVIEVASKNIGESFRDWLKESVDAGGKGPSFRADPILTSSDTTILNKVVANSVDILRSPAEAFLRELGVTFYPGLKNQLVLPYLAEDTAAFPGENTGAASASMATGSLTLAPRRISHTQAISKETLSETNPSIYQSIVENLLAGVYLGVANDVFDTIQTDAPSQKQDAGITYATIAAMEASLAYTNIGTVKFVATPANKATLKTTARMTNQAPIWGDDNKVLGYAAYGVPCANSTMMYMGDFSKCVVGQFGSVEVIVDPYTNAAEGLINLTVSGMFDTGLVNPKAIVWKANA